MEIKIFKAQQNYPDKIIFPQQVHGDKIMEIISGQENLAATDGLFTHNQKFILGVKTADCAPIVFIGKNKFGIIHVGWRGLCSQICEKMVKIFSDGECQIFCGPFLPKFEIQKDFCYEAINKKFGEIFFEYEENKILFNFQAAIVSILPKIKFDGRSTWEQKDLASWRRDHLKNARNITAVGDFIE